MIEALRGFSNNEKGHEMTATRKKGIWTLRVAAGEVLGANLTECISKLKKRLEGV